MSYKELSKNPDLLKTIFVIVEYYDIVAEELKKIYLSDNFFVGLTNGLTGDSVPYEPRIEKIPYFEQEIDPISNEVIIKSSYKIDVINNDDYYRDILEVALFKGQKVSMYSYIEGLDISDSLLLATATIKSIDYNGNNLSLLLEEMFYYNKSNEFAMSKFTSIDGYINDEAKDKYKPTLFGDVRKEQGENLNTTDGKFVNIGGLKFTYDSADGYTSVGSNFSIGGTIITLQNENDAQLFRELINIGESIALELNGGITEIFTVVGYANNSNLKVQLDRLLKGGNITTPKNILINKDDSPRLNDKIFVSDNKEKDYFELNATGTAGNNYISVTGQDLSFMKEDERLEVVRITSVGGDFNDYAVEEYTIDYWDALNSRLYIKELLFKDLTPAFGELSVSIRYYYVQKIAVKDQFFYRARRSMTMNLGSVDDIVNEAKQASATRFGIQITAQNQTLPEDGNGIQVRFIGRKGTCSQPSEYSNDPIGCSIFAGGTWTYSDIDIVANSARSYTIFYDVDLHTNQDIVNYYNSLATPVKDSLNIVLTIRTSISIKPNNLSFTLENGGLKKTYYVFEVINSSTAFIDGNNYNPETIVIYFTKDSLLPGVGPSGTIGTYEVNVSTGDTTSNIADAIIAAFEASIDFSSLLRPCYYYRIGNSITLKSNLRDNLRSIVNIEYSAGAWSYSLSEDYGMAFDTYIENNDLKIQIDYNFLNVAEKLSYGKETSTYLGNMTIYGNAGSSAKEKRMIQFSGDSLDGSIPSLEPGDIIFANNQAGTTSVKSLRHFIIDEVEQYEVSGAKFLRVYVKREIEDFSNTVYNYYVYLQKKSETITDKDVSFYYKDENVHVSDIITKLNDLYDNDEFSSTDLSSLKTDHPFLNSYIIIDKVQQYYKYLNNFLASFSMSSFVDTSGNIRYKFINSLALSQDSSISYFDYYDEDLSFEEYEYNKILVKYAKDLTKDSYQEITLVDAGLDSIAAITKFNESKTVETMILDDIFLEDIAGLSFGEIMSSRYFSNIRELKIKGKEYLFNFNILDVVAVTDSKKIDDDKLWVITKRKTNGKDVELTLTHYKKVIELCFLTDEFGDYILDEFGNKIIVDC